MKHHDITLEEAFAAAHRQEQELLAAIRKLAIKNKHMDSHTREFTRADALAYVKHLLDPISYQQPTVLPVRNRRVG